jgi:hypothetical protein
MVATDIFETKRLVSKPTVQLAAERMLQWAWPISSYHSSSFAHGNLRNRCKRSQRDAKVDNSRTKGKQLCNES